MDFSIKSFRIIYINHLRLSEFRETISMIFLKKAEN